MPSTACSRKRRNAPETSDCVAECTVMRVREYPDAAAIDASASRVRVLP